MDGKPELDTRAARTVKCFDHNMAEYNLAFLLPKLCRELLSRGAGVDGASRGGKWREK